MGQEFLLRIQEEFNNAVLDPDCRIRKLRVRRKIFGVKLGCQKATFRLQTAISARFCNLCNRAASQQSGNRLKKYVTELLVAYFFK
jgi:hypothetical protein